MIPLVNAPMDLSRALDCALLIFETAAELRQQLERGINTELASDLTLFDVLVALNAQAPAVAAEMVQGSLLSRFGQDEYQRHLRAAQRRWEQRDEPLPF